MKSNRSLTLFGDVGTCGCGALYSYFRREILRAFFLSGRLSTRAVDLGTQNGAIGGSPAFIGGGTLSGILNGSEEQGKGPRSFNQIISSSLSTGLQR